MINIELKDRKKILISLAKQGNNVTSFSKKIGVSNTYISQILNGKKNPSVKMAHKIANELDLDVEEVFLIDVIPIN